jgi:hypothetical protein
MIKPHVLTSDRMEFGCFKGIKHFVTLTMKEPTDLKRRGDVMDVRIASPPMDLLPTKRTATELTIILILHVLVIHTISTLHSIQITWFVKTKVFLSWKLSHIERWPAQITHDVLISGFLILWIL